MCGIELQHRLNYRIPLSLRVHLDEFELTATGESISHSTAMGHLSIRVPIFYILQQILSIDCDISFPKIFKESCKVFL